MASTNTPQPAASAANAELSALAGEAGNLDGENAAVIEQPGAQVAPPDPVAETKAIIGVVISMLAPVLTYLPGIYTDEVQQNLAAAYVPVAEKYGWASGSGLFQRFGAEIVLAMTALPVAVATGQAHKQWAAEKKAAAEAEQRENRAPEGIVAPQPEQVAA